MQSGNLALCMALGALASAVPAFAADPSSVMPVPQPQRVDTGLPLAVWLARHPPGSEVDAKGLHDDPRLRAPLTGAMKSPTVPELLARLQSVTHLSMTCEPTTPPPSPVFGNPYFHGTPAYAVMRRMAASGPSKGRWQATADGYHLLLDDPTVASPPPPKPLTASQRRRASLPWRLAATAGLLVLSLSVLIWRILRRPKETSSTKA